MLAFSIGAPVRPVLHLGLRQLVLGGLAIAMTFSVGHLIGAHGV